MYATAKTTQLLDAGICAFTEGLDKTNRRYEYRREVPTGVRQAMRHSTLKGRTVRRSHHRNLATSQPKRFWLSPRKPLARQAKPSQAKTG